MSKEKIMAEKQYKKFFTEKGRKEYEPYRKNFGDGYVLEEMAALEGFITFLLKSKFDYIDGEDAYWERKDWKKFKKYLQEVLKFYRKRNPSLNNFEKIIDAEAKFYSGLWNPLDATEKENIKNLAKRLDEEGRIT